MGDAIRELIRPLPLGLLGCFPLAFIFFAMWLEAFTPPYVKPGHIIFLYGAGIFAIIGALLIWIHIKKRNSENSHYLSVENPLRLSAQAGPDDVEIFEQAKAALFYEEIAPIYESRLTRDYYDSIRAIEREILTRIDGTLNIIDIGGGTGVLFRRFELDERISWTYIDPSRGMHQRFSELYSGVSSRLAILLGSFRGCGSDINESLYDIAVISFVISSFPDAVAWPDIKRILKPGGLVIVADGHPQYGEVEPTFGVKLNDTRKLRLKVAHVDLTSLKKQVAEVGFQLVSEKIIYRRLESNQPYSFLHVYKLG